MTKKNSEWGLVFPPFILLLLLQLPVESQVCALSECRTSILQDDSVWVGDTLIVTSVERDSLFDPITGEYYQLAWYADIYQVFDSSRIITYSVGDIALHKANGNPVDQIRWDAFDDKHYLFESYFVPVYLQAGEYLDTTKTIYFSVEPGDTVTYNIDSRFYLSQPSDGEIIPDDFSFRTEIMCALSDTLVEALDTLYISSSDSLSDLAEAFASRYAKYDSLPDPSMIGRWIAGPPNVTSEISIYIRVVPEYYGADENEAMIVRYYTDASVNHVVPDDFVWPLDSICARIERGDTTFINWALDSTFVQKLLTFPKYRSSSEERDRVRNDIMLHMSPSILSGIGTLEVSIQEVGTLDIYITNLMGRVLYHADLGLCNVGESYIIVNADSMPSGVCTAWALFNKSVLKSINFLVVR